MRLCLRPTDVVWWCNSLPLGYRFSDLCVGCVKRLRLERKKLKDAGYEEDEGSNPPTWTKKLSEPKELFESPPSWNGQEVSIWVPDESDPTTGNFETVKDQSAYDAAIAKRTDGTDTLLKKADVKTSSSLSKFGDQLQTYVRFLCHLTEFIRIMFLFAATLTHAFGPWLTLAWFLRVVVY